MSERTYICRLCGRVFEPKVINETLSGQIILSAKTQILYHLLTIHKKKSLKKKYAKRIK